LDSLEQRSDSVPHDLHANANEEKSGKPDDDVHRGRSQRTSESVRESVTEVNADADQQSREQRVIATEMDPGPTVSGKVKG
jgi:hypothetical protein